MAETPGVTLQMGDSMNEAQITHEEATGELQTDDMDLDTASGDTPDVGSDGADAEVDPVSTPESNDDAPESEDAASEAEGLKDLGEFDPENTQEWDTQYTTEDGKLNKSALSTEYFKNLTDGTEGLNEGTYDYLASKGIDKEFAKQVEAALSAERNAQSTEVKRQDMEIIQQAGGADALQDALKWGLGGGYSEAAQKRFNTITEGSDLDAKKDAVEALMARYTKANPPKRPTSPKRDATKGQTTQSRGVQPFKDNAEWMAASKAAENSPKAQRAVAERLMVSTF